MVTISLFDPHQSKTDLFYSTYHSIHSNSPRWCYSSVAIPCHCCLGSRWGGRGRRHSTRGGRPPAPCLPHSIQPWQRGRRSRSMPAGNQAPPPPRYLSVTRNVSLVTLQLIWIYIYKISPSLSIRRCMVTRRVDFDCQYPPKGWPWCFLYTKMVRFFVSH